MQSIELKILGQKITLKTKEDADKVRVVMDLVSGRLADAEKRSKTGTQPTHVALLALLDLASDYVESKNRVAIFKQEVSKKSKKISEWMDSTSRGTRDAAK